MSSRILFTFVVAGCALAAARASLSATVPAGTMLTVRTSHAISSQDRPGTTFTAQLDQSIVGEGKVVIPAGTKVAGKVETSRYNRYHSKPLTVNLTTISLGGRSIPIQTAGAFAPDATSRNPRAASRGITSTNFTVTPGTKMTFRLAHPLKL
jgi:hypothetical protein